MLSVPAVDIEQANRSIDRLLAASVLGDVEQQFAYLNPEDEVIMDFAGDRFSFTREEFIGEVLYPYDLHIITDRHSAEEDGLVTVAGRWIQGDPRLGGTFYPLVMDAKLFLKPYEDRWVVHRLVVYDVDYPEMESPVYPSPVIPMETQYYTMYHPPGWRAEIVSEEPFSAYTRDVHWAVVSHDAIRVNLWTYQREYDQLQQEIEHLLEAFSWSLQDFKLLETIEIDGHEQNALLYVGSGKDFQGREQVYAEFYVCGETHLVMGRMPLEPDRQETELAVLKEIARTIRVNR